jgi:hypothetical protein
LLAESSFIDSESGLKAKRSTRSLAIQTTEKEEIYFWAESIFPSILSSYL